MRLLHNGSASAFQADSASSILVSRSRKEKMKKLQDVYEKYSTTVCGGDKGTFHSYIDIYQKYMENIKNISLLEIGVQFGHSIAMWNEYFIDSDIYGLDIDTSLVKFPHLKNIFECDATKSDSIPSKIKEIEFDYIIDDGSHRVEDQVRSFNILYPQLKNNGIYFIEDIDSDQSLIRIMNHLRKNGISCIIEDVRMNKGRFDDLMIVVKK